MMELKKNDLVQYIGKLGTVHCQIDGMNCYMLNFEEAYTMYCLIAQGKDITLVSKYSNDIFNEGDKVITLKGEGTIDSVDTIDENVVYGVSLEDGVHYMFRCQVWRKME